MTFIDIFKNIVKELISLRLIIIPIKTYHLVKSYRPIFYADNHDEQSMPLHYTKRQTIIAFTLYKNGLKTRQVLPPSPYFPLTPPYFQKISNYSHSIDFFLIPEYGIY